MALPEGARRQVEKAHALMGGNGQGNPPPATPPADPSEPQPDVNERLNTLQTEVRRLNVALRKRSEESDREIERLRADNERLTREREELAATAKRKYEAGEITGLAEDERNLAGPMLPVVAKVAREVATAAVAEGIKPLHEKLAEYERQHEAAYFATLDSQIPGWNADDGTSINDDPRFYDWLDQIDPQTRRPRMQLLKNAQNARQGHLVVEIVRAYQEGREIGQRAPAKPRATPRVDPPAGGDTPPNPNPQPKGKQWRRSEIADFFRTKRTAPQYQGQEGKARAREIENDIFAAQREGRVVDG